LPAAEFALSRPEEGTLLVSLSGSWRLEASLPSPVEVRQGLESSRPSRLRFDASAVSDWDSGLLTFLRRVLQDCGETHVEADREGLPEGVCRLLALAEAVPEKTDTRSAASDASLLARLGGGVLGLVGSSRTQIGFVGELTLAFGRLLSGRASFPRAEFGRIVQEAGANALGIVALISALVGLILAFMAAIQLEQFGAEIFVANLVGIGMARDMGPIMAGIIMAGRTGAAFAAQLGTMTVNEEIDALRTLGISPMEYLVLPRVLALVLMMPLLALYANVLGIIGGGVVGVGALDIGIWQYWEQTRTAVGLSDFAGGLFKAGVYGIIVAFAGCLRGMQCGRSAAAVGEATTSAVVTGIVGIIVACGVLTVLYDILGI